MFGAMNGSGIQIDQFCSGFSSGDAISNMALVVRRYLRERGFRSDIYCEQFAEKDSGLVSHFSHYAPRADSVMLYHHSFHTEFLERLAGLPVKKILIFHNVTPARYVETYNRAMASSLDLARKDISEYRAIFSVCLADSRFNAGTLGKLGYTNVRVMPVPLELNGEAPREIPPHLRYLKDGKTNILFVGRIFPNKMHQDLIKAFYFYRKIAPDSRLLLVGPFHPGVRGYTGELFNLTRELGLGESVVFTDMVSDEELRAFYANARLFLSMSDHEGFFVPLAESMSFDLPILAFGSSVIPETLGESGVIFYRKDYRRIAELMRILTQDEEIRARVLAAQRVRLREFAPEKSIAILEQTLAEIGLS